MQAIQFLTLFMRQEGWAGPTQTQGMPLVVVQAEPEEAGLLHFALLEAPEGLAQMKTQAMAHRYRAILEEAHCSGVVLTPMGI